LFGTLVWVQVGHVLSPGGFNGYLSARCER
jgi:hypothetical protein